MEQVLPLAKALKAIYLKYGVGYRIGQVQDGPNKDDWFVVVTYADTAALENSEALFAKDAEIQRLFNEISKFAKRNSRELVRDLDI